MKRQDDQPMQPDAAFEFEVYDAQTDEHLGRLGDITHDGLSLLATRAHDLDEQRRLRIAGSRDSGWTENLEADVVVVGTRQSMHTDFHDNEFRFVDPTPELRAAVDRMQRLTEPPSPETT
jgi:hypothetical protein